MAFYICLYVLLGIFFVLFVDAVNTIDYEMDAVVAVALCAVWPIATIYITIGVILNIKRGEQK